jgi:ABC-type dipeptide/oligopeptide/nickel transport system permease subunit
VTLAHSLWGVTAILALSCGRGFARLVRGEVLSWKRARGWRSPMREAAGASPARIVGGFICCRTCANGHRRACDPQSGYAIVVEASLTFWSAASRPLRQAGRDDRAGRGLPAEPPGGCHVSGVAVALTVLESQSVRDWLRDTLDPHCASALDERRKPMTTTIMGRCGTTGQMRSALRRTRWPPADCASITSA